MSEYALSKLITAMSTLVSDQIKQQLGAQLHVSAYLDENDEEVIEIMVPQTVIRQRLHAMEPEHRDAIIAGLKTRKWL